MKLGKARKGLVQIKLNLSSSIKVVAHNKSPQDDAPTVTRFAEQNS